MPPPSHHHKKINGVHPPLSCPRDFADQVRVMVSRYNQCIDDCDAYQNALSELQKSYRLLWKQHNELKEASEKLAEKYEKLISDAVDEETSHLESVGSESPPSVTYSNPSVASD